MSSTVIARTKTSRTGEPEDPAAKRVDDDEELPLGEAPTLEGAEESDDEY